MKTLTVDAHKRIRLGQARPGDCYSVEASPDGGRFVLVRVTPEAPRRAKVRFEKRGRFTVGIVDRPIDEQALQQALEEFR